jgi:hypothetical protein
MRHYPHRVKVTHTSPLEGSPETTVHESLPCRFNYLDAIKNEQLYGAQSAQGSVVVPKHVQIVADDTTIEEYRFYLVSPLPNDLVRSMQPLMEKLSPIFRYFLVQVFQH